MASIFVSYKRVDKEKVLCIIDKIQNELNVPVWMDVEEIKSDAQFAAEIIDAIDQADVFLFMFSVSHTNIVNYKTDWTIRELNYAQEQNKRIVFINIDGTPLVKWFSFMFPQKQQVNAQSEEEVNKLIRDINMWLGGNLMLNTPNDAERLIQNNLSQKKNPTSKTVTYHLFGVSFKMVKVTKGDFLMGTIPSLMENTQMVLPKTSNSRRVVLTKSFYIGETPVTQGLWKVVMQENPSRFINASNPVDSVSWEDCQYFIARLNRMIGINFRLPTEAEWEFAARGGIQSRNFHFSGSDDIDEVAWCLDNSQKQTHPVKQKKANELGLYDMSGNVWEWCQDYYDDLDVENADEIFFDPVGPQQGSHHVYRGGCWCETDDCGLTVRRAGAPDFASYGGLGLRLALTL